MALECGKVCVAVLSDQRGRVRERLRLRNAGVDGLQMAVSGSAYGLAAII